MKKVNKSLTHEQIERGVIFSSTLSEHRNEQSKDTMHEVFTDDEDKINVIDRLLDNKFFRNSHFVYNIIRRGEPKNPQILETKPLKNLKCYDAARTKKQLASIYWAAKQSYKSVKVYKTTTEANEKEFPYTIYVDHKSVKR